MAQDPTPEQFAVLFQAVLENTSTPEDTARFLNLVEESAYRQLLDDLVEGALSEQAIVRNRKIELLSERLDKRLELILAQKDNSYRKAPVRMMRRWMAAAAVVLFAIAGTYFLLNEKKPVDTVVVMDVKAPDKTKAIIRLSNGRTVFLDSLKQGSSLQVDGVTITKLRDGSIVYSGEGATTAYNTASNPRGSTVMPIELSDHSLVWLNAGSSISYPVNFTGKERRVTIDGEAYFEVAHNASKPFIVSKGSTAIQVLGTHFNVKAYDNEPDQKVTLLEGKVRVNAQGKEQLLSPSEQAIVKDGTVTLRQHANLDDVMAWKNGSTTFHEADMHEILRELERWYDITTEMKKEIRTTRMIDVPRNIPLKDMLRALLDENGIAYEYDAEKRKLTILP